MYCQKCKTLLQLDGSLDHLTPAAFNLLADASTTAQHRGKNHYAPSRRLYSEEQKQIYAEAQEDAQSPIFKRIVAPPQNSLAESTSGQINPAAMSFVMLTESQVIAPHVARDAASQTPTGKNPTRNCINYAKPNEQENLLSHKMETASRLFEVLSSRSDIDHPICVECTELLIDGLEKRLSSATKEKDMYLDFLRNANADFPTDEERQQIQAELNSVQEEEKLALSELERLEAEQGELEKELIALDQEEAELQVVEENFWRERNKFAQTLSDFQNERDSVNLRYDHDARLLERLQRTNVFNDIFNISHDGPFATINGLRLGRLSGYTVEWPEINAAWGQICLLLATCAEKLSYTFQGYRLNPIGSTSTIERFEVPSPSASRTGSEGASKTKPTTLPLYYSSDLPLSIGFLHRNFDAAMTALLECIRQLSKHVERTIIKEGDGVKVPYAVDKDKINNVSIKLGSFGGDESWTKACKFTLTCCKFLLACASNVNPARRSGG